MTIKRIDKISPEVLKTVQRLLGQLTTQKRSFSQGQLTEIIEDKNTYLFFSMEESGDFTGMLTLGLYKSPTGNKAWIEDVVVDEKYRGNGIGKALVEYAIQVAREQKADSFMLTSNPSRINANHLYQKLGFERKETNVYKMLL